MQEGNEAERRAVTRLAAGFDEGQPGGVRSALEGRGPSHTTNMKHMAMKINSSTNISKYLFSYFLLWTSFRSIQLIMRITLFKKMLAEYYFKNYFFLLSLNTTSSYKPRAKTRRTRNFATRQVYRKDKNVAPRFKGNQLERLWPHLRLEKKSN